MSAHYLIKKSLETPPAIETLYGTHDENLRLLEDKLNVTIDLRSDAIQVTGEPDNIARVEQVFTDFDTLRKSGINLHNGELNGMLKLVVADPAITLKSLVDSSKQRSACVKRMVQPRTPNQRKYVEAIEQCHMTFGLGPAGTVNTYLPQTALPNPKKSRLLAALHVLDGVEGIRFCHFEDVDVVRHHLVQPIVRAYDSHGKAQQQLPLALGETVSDPALPAPLQQIPKTQEEVVFFACHCAAHRRDLRL